MCFIDMSTHILGFEFSAVYSNMREYFLRTQNCNDFWGRFLWCTLGVYAGRVIRRLAEAPLSKVFKS